LLSDGSENESCISENRREKYLDTGKTFRNIINDRSTSLLFFQLPSFLPSTSDKILSSDQQTQMPGPSSTAQSNISRKNDNTSQNELSHCLEQFPPGSKIGKLQLLRSGRVVMSINGHKMDITEAIPTNCFETAVQIETQTDKSTLSSDDLRRERELLNGLELFDASEPSPLTTKPQYPISNPKFTSHGSLSSSPSPHLRNVAQIFGEIPYHFACSFNFHEDIS